MRAISTGGRCRQLGGQHVEPSLQPVKPIVRQLTGTLLHPLHLDYPIQTPPTLDTTNSIPMKGAIDATLGSNSCSERLPLNSIRGRKLLSGRNR